MASYDESPKKTPRRRLPILDARNRTCLIHIKSGKRGYPSISSTVMVCCHEIIPFLWNPTLYFSDFLHEDTYL